MDPLSVDDLFRLAITSQDEDQAWSAIERLQSLKTEMVFAEAVRLCHSQDARQRRVGVDVLGQWGLSQQMLELLQSGHAGSLPLEAAAAFADPMLQAHLSSGMEAEVYAYGPDAVLKLYAGTTSRTDLLTLQDFYNGLDRQRVPYALPRIHTVAEEADVLITVEQRLVGTQLSTLLPTLPCIG